MAAAASSNSPASPIVHAIGGSVGSALALLLFYPLERARIDIQSRASQQNDQGQLLNSVEVNFEDHQAPSSPPVVGTADGENGDGISATSSWSPIQSEKFLTPERPGTKRSGDPVQGWDLESNSSDSVEKVETDIISSSHDRDHFKSELLQCLVDLRARGALYQGVTPVISTIFVSQFVFFFIHAYVKALMQKMQIFGRGSQGGTAPSKAVMSLASSCIAGVGNVLLTNPLWVANMAIITGESKSTSLIRELANLCRQRGIRHLWSGTATSILLVSNPVIQFFSYEQLKNARFAYTVRMGTSMDSTLTLPPLEAFLAGAIAKTIATVATYPLQLTQTLLRLENNRYKGIMDCLIKLYRRDGHKEWFTGMKAKLLQTVLNASFMFLTYEQIVGAIQLALMQSSGVSMNVSR